MKDQYGQHVHIEELEDTPEALPQDDLQQHLQQLLRHLCRKDCKQDNWEAATTQPSSPLHSTHRYYVHTSQPTSLPEDTVTSTCFLIQTFFFPYPIFHFRILFSFLVHCKLSCDQRAFFIQDCFPPNHPRCAALGVCPHCRFLLLLCCLPERTFVKLHAQASWTNYVHAPSPQQLTCKLPVYSDSTWDLQTAESTLPTTASSITGYELCWCCPWVIHNTNINMIDGKHRFAEEEALQIYCIRKTSTLGT